MIRGPKKKKSKGKEQFSFAKDKKQAVMAIVAISLFLGNTLFMVVKGVIANSPANGNSEQSSEMLAQQEMALDGLNPNTPANPSASPLTGTAGLQPGETMPGQAPNPEPPDALSSTAQSSIPGVNPSPAPNAEDDIEIMAKQSPSSRAKRKGKMILVTVGDSGRTNPFLPAGENILPTSAYGLPKLNILAPPETLSSGSEAGKIMTTTISGILYDKYSPSAIINIEGSDYLVKRGDIINHYKVLVIGKTEVIVQLGRNIYKAGVGELLSKTNINYNTIANLNKKFGGNEIQVNVKKKGY